MADQQAKLPGNIPGRFFVDDQCIACDACVKEAPQFFAMNDEEGHAYVQAQPEKKGDIEKCISALNLCPVEAIGDSKS